MSEKNTGKYLDFKDFCIEIKRLLLNRFEEGYRVELNRVTKNNAIQLEGVVILQKDEIVAPNIYLNNYYVGYQNGLSFHDIIQNISEEYYNARKQGDVDAIVEGLEFTNIKDTIVYRLINYEKNNKLLLQIPHRRFLDLAVTFHCLIRSSEDGIGTIRITNRHLSLWNVTINDLILHAKENTPRLFPPVVQSMKKVIEELMEEESNKRIELAYESKEQEEYLTEIYHQENVSGEYDLEDNMLVISNQRNINGASCMIYPDLLKEIADMSGTDLYILPSSIHELIIVKNDHQYRKEILKEMVKEINLTQVPIEDVLSDSIYYYSRNRLAVTQL